VISSRSREFCLALLLQTGYIVGLTSFSIGIAGSFHDGNFDRPRN